MTPSLHSLLAQAVSSQFASRPTLDTVARQLLAELIRQRYPTLVIDLSRTQLAIPYLGGGWTLHPLIPRVLEFFASGAELDLSDRHGQSCFLTDTPPTRLQLAGPTAPALDMSVIEGLIRELPLTLPTALQNALATYWREEADSGVSRWRWLSDWLADNLSVTAISQPDLDGPEREMLEQLISHPDRDERIRRYAADAVHAYCPQATLKDRQQARTLLSPQLLLTQATRVLLCKPSGACERFASMDGGLQALGQRVAQPYVAEQITAQRWEPDGNIFDAQAALVLNQQLEDLGALTLPAHLELDTLRALCLEISDPTGYFPDSSAAVPKVLATLRQQAPAWLQQASVADRMRYGRYGLALASAKKRSNGRTFLSDIPDIRTFATNALLQQLKRDEITFDKVAPERSKATQFHPDDLLLTFSVAAGYPGGAGFVELVHMSLTDLAIKNLQGQPHGQLTVQHRRSLPLPSWLTPDYIQGSGGLIEQVDIGKTYPERLDTQLLGDSEQARQRTARFAQQTVAQLPMLALELSLNHQNGMTPRGARYVAALMGERAEQRQAEGQAIVIRHLALVRKPQATPDVVTNMYIIESESALAGPHLLYRPLYADSLQEFASREDLLQAIARPGELQTSVLTWLSDGARPIYDNGGFQAPHYPRFGMGDEFSVPEVPKPATLAIDGSNEKLRQSLSNGQLMQFLYGSNARALIEQADRASVSNHESRWAVLLEGAGLLFNTLLLPLARGPCMLSGWLLSLMSSASHDIPALASDDPVTRELALVDLLLNIGMLMHQWLPTAARPGAPLASAVKKQALRSPIARLDDEQWPRPPAPAVHQGPVVPENEGVVRDDTVFDFSFSSARNQLTPNQRKRLAGFRAAKPEPLPKPESDGPRKGLYSYLGDWYTLLDTQWYQLSSERDAGVVIVDPLDRTRLGPFLQTDGLGNWSLDLRLRLRGGMPPKRIAAEQKRQADRKQQLSAEYQQFSNDQQAQQKKADDAEMLMNLAATNTKYSDAAKASTRRAFDRALHSQSEGYRKILDSRKEREELHMPFPAPARAALLENIINNARKSVVIADMDRQALYAMNREFTGNETDRTPAILANLPRYLQFLSDMSEINERQIQALELKDQYLLELFNLGQPGLEGYNRLTLNRPAELGALAVKYLQLNNLKYLSIKIWGHSANTELDSLLRPLHRQVRTHSELNTLSLAPDDRLNVLDSLFRHYGQALDALQGMVIVHADNLHMAYFQRIQKLLEGLYQDVMQQLAAEIRPEPHPVKRPPKRPMPAEGAPQKKVIKTRRQGVLIGDLKPAGTTLPIDVVEVRSEEDDQLLGTYSRRENQWDEIREVRPAAPSLPPGTRALSVVKGEARKYMQDLLPILNREAGYARVSRYPIEIQESLHKEADRFTKLADELHRSIQAQPEGSRVPADQHLLDEMRAAVTTLTTKGRELRVQRTLELPPNDAHLVYLLEQDLVQLARLGPRIAMRGERPDFIQEYAINDKRGYPLWYAHFHYAKAETPKHDYAVAHLKTKEQRRESYYSLLAKARSPQSVVDVHHSTISPELAESRFLPLAP
jgi:hypothetical protein